MRALLINTTFFALVIAFAWSMIRAVRFGDEGVKQTWRLLRELLTSHSLTAVLVLGAAVNVLFVIAAGYINPRDYVQDEIAARQFLTGGTLYPSDLPQRGIQELSGPIPGTAVLEKIPGVRADFSTLHDPPVLANAHPPFLGIVLAAPVALLGLRDSFLLLAAISVVLLYWSFTAILRETAGAGFPLACLLGLIFGWYATGTALRAVQPSIFILALLVSAWLLLRRNRPWPAGAAIGVAVWVHAFPALLALYLLVRHRRAFISSAVTISLIGAAIGALAGFQTFAEWLHTVDSTSKLFVPALGNRSLAGVFASLANAAGWGAGVKPLEIAGFLLVVIPLVLCMRPGRRIEPSPARLDLEYSVFVAALLLASPLSWSRYYPILLLPFAVLLKYSDAGRRWTIPLVLLVFALLSFPDSAFVPLQQEALGSARKISVWLLSSLASFAMIVVFGWLIRLLSHDNRSPAGIIERTGNG